MNRFRLFTLLIPLAVLGVGLTAVGQPVSICDYTPPTNQLTELTLSGEYHQFEDKYLDDRNNVNSGSLLLQGFAWSEQDNWSYNLDGQANLRITPSGLELASTLSSEGQARYYVQGDNFVFGGVDTTGVPGTGLTVSGLAGAGMGRFRNVTPMAKAIQIANALHAQDVLEEFPSEEKMNQLSRIIGSDRSMSTSEMLQEIEGLFETSFDVQSVLALQGVINTQMTRFCGWDVTAGVGYPVLVPTDEHNPFLRARANYALTLDPNGRLLVRAEGRLPLPPANAYRVNASLDYHRTLSPTSTLTTTYQYTRVQEPTGENYATHTLDLAVSAQVQAPLSLTAKAHGAIGDRFEEPEWGFDLGFEYRLF